MMAVLLLLLLSAVATAAATGEKTARDRQETQLISAYKRQPFRYYTAAGLYEFKRSESPSEQLPEDEEIDNNLVSWVHPPHKRHAKRSEKPRSAVLELLVVVDNGLYESHLSRIANSKSKQSVKTYYEYFVGYINKVFEAAVPNFKVTVMPAAIAVIKRKNARDWSERNRVTVDGREFILANPALHQFRHWLGRHRARLPTFDHAVALTQYLTGIKIDGAVHEIKGIAQLGQMCQVGPGSRINSVSLVHDSGTLAGALTAVHEIAHSFGVNHDGERESAACPDDGQFVMSAALAMSETATRFSPCSQRALLRFLESPKAACLFQSEAQPERRLVETNLLPGQVYSKDFQCQRQKFQSIADPHFCKIPWFTPTTLEMSCSSLYCQDGAVTGSMKCAGSVPAIMGTPCGNKKICLNNKCTFSPKAPCCPLEEEDAAACGRLKQMGLGCQQKMMQLYCCKFCGHKCDEK